MTQVDEEVVASHSYTTHEARADSAWLMEVAREYVALRSASAAPLAEVPLDGVDVVSVDGIRKRLLSATIPTRSVGPLAVLRSDFGELLLYSVLESLHGTRIGYKSIRDRETAQLPGRGIDAVGIESGAPGARITLVIGEAKVSDEQRTPPRVVEPGPDSLRGQHLGHLSDRSVATSKVFDQARHVADTELRDRLLAAALLFEAGDWRRVRVVACCVLVRSRGRFVRQDFGCFRARPQDFAPADVRFHVVCLPAEVDETIIAWSDALQRLAAAA